MSVKYNLSIKEMKKVAHEIIDEELEKANVKCDVFPLTFVEYFKNSLFNESFNLVRVMNILSTSDKLGTYYGGSNKIFVFLSSINKCERLKGNILNLVQTCYHEARHAIQDSFDPYRYDGFLNGLDTLLAACSNTDYAMAHDQYSYEIGANLYGIKKTKEYIIKNYPTLYEKQKDKINELEDKYIFDYMTYDASNNLDMVLLEAKKWINKRKQASDSNYSNFDYDEIGNLYDICPALEIFMKKNLSFKKMSKIMNHEKFNKVDKEIIYTILSSKSFLDQIDMNLLSDEELSLLNESLQYTYTVYQNQRQFIEDEKNKNKIMLVEYLKSQKSLIYKIGKINKYLTSIINMKLDSITDTIIQKNNSSRNEKTRQEHIDSIPIYLEKSKTLKRKKSDMGYSFIGIFYIVGGLFSILTIIYLLIR